MRAKDRGWHLVDEKEERLKEDIIERQEPEVYSSFCVDICHSVSS